MPKTSKSKWNDFIKEIINEDYPKDEWQIKYDKYQRRWDECARRISNLSKKIYVRKTKNLTRKLLKLKNQEKTIFCNMKKLVGI